MYHTVIPVSDDYNPIVVEGSIKTQVLIFNAGPAAIKVQAWDNWKGKQRGGYENSEANYSLELRPGNERIVSGSLIRAAIHKKTFNEESFAAIGVLVIAERI
ncbi:hypothetical protein AM493_00205 [Flavobacterium akiainvivens]|uniref:Uncharacterized protein n=1 Tax=Flavobacterium akiainvivens TaxID=1202724 RepID=A0A0M9VGM3_9FLAO|nr:hypothetical protein [Flavobacterium akiainvivens]KOS04636.1 hypothetical protein AM493_00205 [Flavobacterium akiainvivens]SFQ65625.1 hypothetical protein SAMN05444144_11283 [Flavobacterium akiainvivens]